MKRSTSNWRKYSFEFLSIFFAVILAFALNNWNENRKESIAENKILTEIYIGLEADLKDHEINEKGHRTGVAAAAYFKNFLANKSVSTDSAHIKFYHLTRDFVSIINTSGYETLKSRGLELIKNDSLRTKIISLYEYDYNTLKKLEEEYSEMQYHQNYFKDINSFLAPNFIFDENNNLTRIKTPFEISEQDEKLFLTYLWKIQSNRNFILRYYSQVVDKIKAIQTEIEQEIDLAPETQK